jgi:hypothetical protein
MVECAQWDTDLDGLDADFKFEMRRRDGNADDTDWADWSGFFSFFRQA